MISVHAKAEDGSAQKERRLLKDQAQSVGFLIRCQFVSRGPCPVPPASPVSLPVPYTCF